MADKSSRGSRGHEPHCGSGVCNSCGNQLGTDDYTTCLGCRTRRSSGQRTAAARAQTSFRERSPGRQGRFHNDHYRQRSPAPLSAGDPVDPSVGRSYRPRGFQPGQLDHLRAAPGRRVPLPCRRCSERGLKADNHYYHECMYLGSVTRRAAKRRFNIAHSPPMTSSQQPQQPLPSFVPNTVQPSSAPESDLSRSLRDKLELFLQRSSQDGMSLLQVALTYRARLSASRIDAIISGREVELRGELFAWIDAYIASIPRNENGESLFSRPTFDWEAVVGVLAKAQSVEQALKFTLGTLRERQDVLSEGLDHDQDFRAPLTRMIAILERAINDLALTLSDEQIERLGRQAHADVGAVISAWRPSTQYGQ